VVAVLGAHLPGSYATGDPGSPRGGRSPVRIMNHRPTTHHAAELVTVDDPELALLVMDSPMGHRFGSRQPRPGQAAGREQHKKQMEQFSQSISVAHRVPSLALPPHVAQRRSLRCPRPLRAIQHPKTKRWVKKIPNISPA